MKKKKTLYILLPLTLAVWGLILFKLFSGFGGDEEYGITSPQGSAKQNETKKLPDHFKLFLNYPDPFLSANTISNSNSEKAPSYNDIKAGILNKAQQWPEIRYFGLVKNQRTKARRINLGIGSQMYILKEKDKVDYLRLEKIHADSVIISFKHERKTIYKQ